MKEESVNDVTKVKITMLIDKDLIKQIKHYALDHDTNATAVATQAFKDFLSKKK